MKDAGDDAMHTNGVKHDALHLLLKYEFDQAE